MPCCLNIIYNLTPAELFVRKTKWIGAEIYSAASTCDYATPSIGSSSICINLLFTAFSALFLCYRTDDILCGILATVVVYSFVWRLSPINRLLVRPWTPSGEQNCLFHARSPSVRFLEFVTMGLKVLFTLLCLAIGSINFVHSSCPRDRNVQILDPNYLLYDNGFFFMWVDSKQTCREINWRLIEFIAMGCRAVKRSSSTSIQRTKGEIKVLVKVCRGWQFC